jgi:hypothetical protein
MCYALYALCPRRRAPPRPHDDPTTLGWYARETFVEYRP